MRIEKARLVAVGEGRGRMLCVRCSGVCWFMCGLGCGGDLSGVWDCVYEGGEKGKRGLGSREWREWRSRIVCLKQYVLLYRSICCGGDVGMTWMYLYIYILIFQGRSVEYSHHYLSRHLPPRSFHSNTTFQSYG